MTYVEAFVKPGRKRLHDGAMLADHKLPKLLVIFVQGALMALSEAKSKVRHIFVTRNPAYLDESLWVVLEPVKSMDRLMGDLKV